MRWGIRMSRGILMSVQKIRMLVRLFPTHWIRANIRRTVQLILGRDRFLRDVVWPLQDDRAPDRGNGQDQRKRRLPQGVKIGHFWASLTWAIFSWCWWWLGSYPRTQDHEYLFNPGTLIEWGRLIPGNTKGGSITVPLTSCLTGLDLSVLQIKTKIVSRQTADSKPVKQEVNGTVIFPPLVFLG